MIDRRGCKKIWVGDVPVGGDALITVQSMTNTDTTDVDATVRQIGKLTDAGCEIVRVAVPTIKAAKSLSAIKKRITIPLIADIHFNHHFALIALEQGVDGLRINPGNIGDREKVRAVVSAAKERNVPIRIGVNGGSLEADLLEKYGHPTAEAMVESAFRHIRILEDIDYTEIKISLKSSDVVTTVEAYRLLAKQCDYPLHVGITETGSLFSGMIKSAAGIGTLLAEGIGDTIRVSLTSDPVEEVKVGWEILKALNLRKRGIEIISCPTCGRTQIDLISLVETVEDEIRRFDVPIKVAVMGCVVNGPGEAREADVGIAGGNGFGILFRNGNVIKKVNEDELLSELIKEIEKIQLEHSKDDSKC